MNKDLAKICKCIFDIGYERKIKYEWQKPAHLFY